MENLNPKTPDQLLLEAIEDLRDEVTASGLSDFLFAVLDTYRSDSDAHDVAKSLCNIDNTPIALYKFSRRLKEVEELEINMRLQTTKN